MASPRIPFALNAISFAGSALILIRLPRQPALAARAGVWRQVPASLRALRTVSVVAPLLLMQALAALSVGATSALLVVLAERAYGLNGVGYGGWLAVIGAGALMGPLLVPALTRLSPARAVPAAYVIRGAGDVGLGLLSNGVAGSALLFVYGLNTSSGTVAFQTLVQEAVPAHLRGRAFALLDVTWQLGRLVSIAVGGAVAAGIGIRPVFLGGGCLLLLAGALGLRRLHSAQSSASEPQAPATPPGNEGDSAASPVGRPEG
jgi:predicted MFS family arabinose efflux permease